LQPKSIFLGILKSHFIEIIDTDTINCRSFQNFDIAADTDRMPEPLIRAMAILKKAAATVNKQFGLKAEVAEAIVKAADEVCCLAASNEASRLLPSVIVSLHEVISGRSLRVSCSRTSLWSSGRLDRELRPT
jgi:hypothetical protein